MAGREKRKRRRKERSAGPARRVSPSPQPIAPNGEPVRKSKDDLAREALVPLEEGERPVAVTIAAIIAALLGLANLVLFAVGAGVGDTNPNAGGAITFAILMLVAAVGMWNARYWAVLGFQAILALSVVSLALFLAVGVTSVLSALAATVLLAAAGTLFWFLVRALARIQMPERRPPT